MNNIKLNTSVNTIESLYSKYANKVYNLAFQMTGDEDLSHDIKQDTFIKVIENLHSFRFDSDIYTWIYAIAKNLCYQRLRRHSRKSFQAIEDLIDKGIYLKNTEDFADLEKSVYINQVKEGCLLGVLRCLSFYQRISFIFNTILEIPITEISRIIGKSENATRILIHRARNRLKSFLCSNCSLYDKSNRCKCENLISFSLRQGWIERFNPSINIQEIEEEITELKNEVLLYKTIRLKVDKIKLREKLTQMIIKSDYKIFSQKKVK